MLSRNTVVVLAFTCIHTAIHTTSLWSAPAGFKAHLFVSPKGNDKNPGTATRPFASLQRAIDAVRPGQVICLRGGTYQPTRRTLFKKGGTNRAGFEVRSFPGEVPVIDAGKLPAEPTWVFQVASYWRIRGPLHLTNGRGAGVMIERDCRSIVFDQVESSYNGKEVPRGGHGFMIFGKGIEDILFENCDAHHNANHKTKPGEDVKINLYQHGDGWRIFSGKKIKLTGCRAWHNLDDGYDFTQAVDPVEMVNCWAAYSGIDDAKGSLTGTPNKAMPRWEGDGIKLGYDGDTGKHRAIGCLSWGNHCHGWNVQGGPYEILNGVAFRNNELEFFVGKKKPQHDMRNTLSFHDPKRRESLKAGNRRLTLSARDFVTLNDKGMLGPRGPNGSLPRTGFLHLARGSRLIDAGVDVGQPFEGKAPDIGCFEYREGKKK